MTSSLGSLFVDHSDLSTFSQAISLNSDQVPSQQLDQQFWATPERSVDSLVQETLEITLTSPRLVNTLSFDVARYPHTSTVEYFTDLGVWAPLIDGVTGAPVVTSIVQSVPAKLPKATAVPGHLHPQHSYAGHWEHVSLQVKPTTLQRFRLVLQRSLFGQPPLDAFGRAIPYSLAVSSLLIGYRISSLAEVPRTALQADSFTTRQSFATTDDLLGSSVDYSLRTNFARNVIGNTDAQASLIWRCEPQPYPRAVVSFYTDLRDPRGQGQVVDRIFIDPINNGAHLSLYYCNQTPVGGFNPVADPLTAAQASFSGTAGLRGDALHLGFYGENAAVGIDNTNLGFDPSLPWWIGIRARTNYDQGVDGTEHPLFDCSAFRISITADGLLLTSSAGDVVDLTLTYINAQDITLIASYDGVNFFLRAITAQDDEQVTQAASTVIVPTDIPALSLGSDLAGTVFANVELFDFILKEELLPDEGFLTAPDVYSSVTQFATDDGPSAANALLRLDSTNSLISTAYPSGLFGGPAAKYEQMVWTPIPRDYLMQRGWMFLPATKVKFLKMEFTNLQAEYRDVYVPTTQLIKTFPPDVLADFAQRVKDRSVTADDLGLLTMSSLTSASPYIDFPVFISTGGTQKGYSNTEAYVADDYTSGNRLYQSRGWMWGYQALHSPSSAPRWNKVAKHDYTTELVTSTTKLAYFVGLRRIQFARTVFTGQDDAAQYEDMLIDEANIVTSNWVFDPEHEALSSGDAAKAQAISSVFGSSRNLRGIQFAAQQSEPAQLLLDPDFADPKYQHWTFIGDAEFTQSATLSPLVGTVLPVTRSIVTGYWGDIAPLYPTWGDLVAGGVTYGQLITSGRTRQTEGGIASVTPVAQPAGGRLLAAARVVAPADLVSPLWVQIVDATTGAVLAEESAIVRRDQVTEWFTEYTIGEGGTFSPVLWGDLVGPPGTAYPSLADSFGRPNAATLGVMDSGQQWLTGANGLSLTIVSLKAKTTVVGQSNYVDTSSPWGSLKVTLGNAITTGTASASVMLMDLGGYKLMNDGRIVSTATTNATAPLFTPATNDQLRFDFMPTKGVPVGQLPAGGSATLLPYAMVIYRNNNWVATVLTAREFLTLRGIGGQVNQLFSTFVWTPSYAEVPTGTNVVHMPMPSDGSLSADSTYWTASDGSQWFLTGAYTFTTGVSYLGAISTATPSATGVSSITRDYIDTFGSFVINITQLAAGVTTTTYMLAILDIDFENVITTYLRADGAVVSVAQDGTVTVLKSGAVPSPANGTLTVRYVPTSILSSTFKTTYSVQPTHTKALIFVQNGAVQGVFSGGDTLWVSTWRGIVSYNDGAAHFTIHEGMSWSPDASQVALDTRARTWGDVDQNNTLTWGDLAFSQNINTDPVVVQVVQKAASGDTWYMDTLSLFSDPIVWEFSNDGGRSWVPGLDIRNNPKGVLLFPPPSPGASNPNPPQNKLTWRVTAWGPNAWISHLVIRPWYQGLTQGIPPRTAASQQGPNVNPYDHYPPIEQDPRFRVWNKPIPRSWWFAYRDHDPTHISDITAQWLTLLAGDALVLPETP